MDPNAPSSVPPPGAAAAPAGPARAAGAHTDGARTPPRLDTLAAGLTSVMGATSLAAFVGASAALASMFVMGSAAFCAMLVALVPVFGFLLVLFVVGPMLFMAGAMLLAAWMGAACLWACTSAVAWAVVALRRRR